MSLPDDCTGFPLMESSEYMVAKPVQPSPSPDTLALYDKSIATNPQIERKGVKLPYTFVNGNMFTFVSASGIVALRLAPGAREWYFVCGAIAGPLFLVVALIEGATRQITTRFAIQSAPLSR